VVVTDDGERHDSTLDLLLPYPFRFERGGSA
jgi:hypothetical protein